MPQGRTSRTRIRSVTLAKGSYGGYWVGMTFHRGHPLPVTPLNERWRMRMQGKNDAFVLLGGEGDVTNEFTTDYEKFDLYNLNESGKIINEAVPCEQKTLYAVAPLNAAAAVVVGIIEEA